MVNHMAELIFNSKELRELRRQCLHYNVFPLLLSHHLDEPPAVASLLNSILDDCNYQLGAMSADEITQVVSSISAGYRMMLEPIPDPLTPEYLRRVATSCVAVEIQKGYSPVCDVVHAKPSNSTVLETCPELGVLIDDDGLVTLTDDFTLLDGGIKYGEYLLHYHQFLRRGFSSNPNFDFLGTLAHYHHRTKDKNQFRIAIDHRRIMLFEHWRQCMELDAWYGPQFDQDTLDDPNHKGLTVVGRIHPNSLDSYALVKTEFLWKTNEGEGVKTLEIEELSCPTTPHDNWHINRYLHAERDTVRRTFRHFDGAAKVYAQDVYPDRVDRTMPNNLRPNHYVKLFRVDGETALEDWLSLTSMFYKGNEMLIEYFDPELFDAKFRPRRLQMHEALTRSQAT